MLRNYKIVFKLPCEKVFSFNLRIFEDDYDPTIEVGDDVYYIRFYKFVV